MYQNDHEDQSDTNDGLTKKGRAEIVSAIQDKMTVRQISQKFGVTRNLVSKVKRAYVEVLHDAIAADLFEGQTIRSIATKHKVSPSTVQRIKAVRVTAAVPAHAQTDRITFRISRAEREAFESKVRDAGLKDKTDALRLMVRNSVGLLDKNSVFVSDVKAVYDELSAIGVNINQIARAVNRGQAPPIERLGPELQSLRRQMIQIMPRLNEIVLEARRSNERQWQAYRQSSGDGESA